MILPFEGQRPQLGEGVFLAPSAVLVGDVRIGSRTSIWFGTVVRGDVHQIRIGARCNVQDGCVLHVTGGRFPLQIGDDVSIGHRAVVHGCTVGDRVLIGMGAVILDGAEIGEDSLVGAGAVVPEGAAFPPGSVILGVPGRRVRSVRPAERERIGRARDDYLQLVPRYGLPPGPGPR